MPLGMCTWCRRYRLVELRTWRSPRRPEQLCGEVCHHCWFGGDDDQCRTCKAKAARSAASGKQTGVRPLGKSEARELFERMLAPRRKRRGAA